MANRTPGVTEKLMEHALQEFLTRGYTDASLRTIAEKAGTSPRAVYTRYGDKEGLFAVLVSEQADLLKALFRNDMETYHAKPVDEQKQLIHLLCSSFVHGFVEFARDCGHLYFT